MKIIRNMLICDYCIVLIVTVAVGLDYGPHFNSEIRNK